MRGILYQAFDGRNDRGVGMPDRRNDFVRRPAATKRLVERNESVARKPGAFGTLLLKRELLSFRVENVEEVRQTSVVTLGGHFGRLPCRFDREIETAHALPETDIGGIGLIDLLHRHQDRAFVRGGELMGAVIFDLDQCVE